MTSAAPLNWEQRKIRKKKAKFFRGKKPTVPENHPVLADERVLETAQQLTTNNEPPSPPQQQSCSAMERKLFAPIERTPVKISHKRCSTETPLAYGNVLIPSEGYKIVDSCILQQLLNSLLSKCSNCKAKNSLALKQNNSKRMGV